MPTKKLPESKHQQRKQAVPSRRAGQRPVGKVEDGRLCQLKARFLSNKDSCCKFNSNKRDDHGEKEARHQEGSRLG